jgi:hypothetical protein
MLGPDYDNGSYALELLDCIATAEAARPPDEFVLLGANVSIVSVDQQNSDY